MDISDEPPERSRAARRASKTRQRLMDAALAVINTHGFDGCSIEDITELADVGKGTFYRYFQDKSSVLRDLLDAAIGDLLARMQIRLAHATSLDLAVASVLGAHAEGFADRPDLFLLYIQTQHMTSARPIVTRGIDPSFAAYFGEIERALSAFLPMDTSEAARQRLVYATAAAIPGFVTSALSRQKDQQAIFGSLESVIRAFLAGVPQLLR